MVLSTESELTGKQTYSYSIKVRTERGRYKVEKKGHWMSNLLWKKRGKQKNKQKEKKSYRTMKMGQKHSI